MNSGARRSEGCTSPTQRQSPLSPPGPERAWEPLFPPSSHQVLSIAEKVSVSGRQNCARVSFSRLPFSKPVQEDSSMYPKKEARSRSPASRTAAVALLSPSPTRGEQRSRWATSLTNWLSSRGVRRWGLSKYHTDIQSTTVINNTTTITTTTINTHTTGDSPVEAPTSSSTQSAACTHTEQTRTLTGLRTAPATWHLHTSSTSPKWARAAPQSCHRWKSLTSWTGRPLPGSMSTWTKWRGGPPSATWRRSWWQTWPPTSWPSPSRRAALLKASSKAKDDWLISLRHALLSLKFICYSVIVRQSSFCM